MLELSMEQCSEYVNKIVSLAESAGCQVCWLIHVSSVYLHWSPDLAQASVRPKIHHWGPPTSELWWLSGGKEGYYQLCAGLCNNVHSQEHTYMSSSYRSYRSNRLGLSHWDPYTAPRGSCLELCYCNMVKWFWWDLSLIFMTNWFPSVI